MTGQELYSAVIERGIQHDHHESDLYLPVNDTTRELIAGCANVQTFASQIDGRLWYDVPFAFMPFWEARQRAAR